MSDAEIKLTPAEMTALNELYRKNIKSALMTLMGISVFLFIFSLIPTGILDLLSRDKTDYSNNDYKRSVIQLMGWRVWLIVYLVVLLVIAFFGARGYKFAQL